MDVQVETVFKDEKKILLMKPQAPGYEGEEFLLTLYKVYPTKDIVLGVFRGIVGKNLVCSFITDPFEGNAVFFREDHKHYLVVLEIKDEKIRKTL
ncbi:MAG: hypothetical protein IJS60_01150 [Abditibacteriota bacterium]|nr:hypothetical protein [Abditibacteriota bacterium]